MWVYTPYRSVSFCSPPNATTVLIEENTSSATAPALAYSFSPSLLNFANIYNNNQTFFIHKQIHKKNYYR